MTEEPVVVSTRVQALGNELIVPESSNDSPTGHIVQAERLGGCFAAITATKLPVWELRIVCARVEGLRHLVR